MKLQDFFYPIRSVASNRAGSDQAWKYFQENFELIKTNLSKASPSLMDAVIVNSVSRFCTQERAVEIENFFKGSPLPSSERRISQLIESIKTNGALLEKIKKSKLMDSNYW